MISVFLSSVPLHCDSKAGVDLSANHVYHAQTKHIEIDCYCIKEKIQSALVHPDILTKGLSEVLFVVGINNYSLD